MCSSLAAGCVVMMIEIASSGGFGGLGSGPTKTVEVDALDVGLRERVCEAFTPSNLRRLSDAPATGADRLAYDITVREQDGDAEAFHLDEGALPAEMLDLIDEL